MAHKSRKLRFAADMYRLCLDFDPDHVMAHEFFGAVGGELAEARQLEDLVDQAYDALSEDQLGKATSIAQQLLKDNPTDDRAVALLDDIQRHVEDVAWAEQKSASQPEPEPASREDTQVEIQQLLAQGEALFQQGQLDKALTRLQRVLELDPANTRAYELEARTKARLSDKREIEDLVAASRELISDGKEDRARKILKDVLGRVPGHEAATALLDSLDGAPAVEATDATAESGGFFSDSALDADESGEGAFGQSIFDAVDQVRLEPTGVEPSQQEEPVEVAESDEAQPTTHDPPEAEDDGLQFEPGPESVEPATEPAAPRKPEARDSDAIESSPSPATEGKRREPPPQPSDDLPKVAPPEPRPPETPQQDRRAPTVAEQLQMRAEKAEPESELPMRLLGGIAAAAVLLVAVAAGVYWYNANQQRYETLLTEAKIALAHGSYDHALSNVETLRREFGIDVDRPPPPGAQERRDWLVAQAVKARALRELERFEESLDPLRRLADFMVAAGVTPRDRVVPGPFEARLFQGEALLQLNRPAEAREVLEKALGDQPSAPRALMYLARAEWLLGDEDVAIERMQEALETGAPIQEVGPWLGQFFYEREKFEEAEHILSRAIAAAPYSSVKAYLLLSKVRRELDLLEEADKTLDRLIQWAPDSVEAYLERAELAREQEDGEKLERALETVLILSPDHTDALVDMALVKYRDDSFEEAVELLNRAVAASPEDVRAQFTLGVVYHKMDEREKALKAYQLATEIDPSHARAWANLGSVHAADRNWRDAISAIEKSLEAEPEQPKLERFLRRIKRRHGN